MPVNPVGPVPFIFVAQRRGVPPLGHSSHLGTRSVQCCSLRGPSFQSPFPGPVLSTRPSAAVRRTLFSCHGQVPRAPWLGWWGSVEVGRVGPGGAATRGFQAPRSGDQDGSSCLCFQPVPVTVRDPEPAGQRHRPSSGLDPPTPWAGGPWGFSVHAS